jgi:glycosyltransferase involved in cell wall biosynthesis
MKIMEPLSLAGDPTIVPEQRSSHLASAAALAGKRAGMVVFSSYPADPRPRRAIEALLREGMSIDLVCRGDEDEPKHESLGRLEVSRVPIKRSRAGKLSYAYQYALFILVSTWMFAARAIRNRYDLIYVHNMPDVLVLTSIIPKMLGARVILDQHDPMPELMRTIFNSNERSWSVRLITWLEKWSVGRVDLVLTVNDACKTIFGRRSCPPEKIGVVMNCPDASIFPFRAARSCLRHDAKPFTIMYHGSLVERNGLDLAVNALEIVRGTIPNVELRICGKRTPFLSRVMGQVRERGLAECVRYLGPKSLEELVNEIAACDVGVIPNHRNPFTEINTPTRIFEYLALGKPVIAPRTPGIQNYFTDDSLFFFESGDAVDLARELGEVYDDPEGAVNVTERGQQVYLAHLWSEESQTLVSLVCALLERDRRSS